VSMVHWSYSCLHVLHCLTVTVLPVCLLYREVFFVPYLWDVIVGALTTSTLEWSREKILVFPLNEDTETLPHDNGTNNAVEKTEFDNTPDVV